MEDLELKINMLADGELSNSEQVELFAELSNNEEARKIYNEALNLKRNVASYYSQVHVDLAPFNYPKLQPVVIGKAKVYKYASYISTAAAVILVMLLAMSESENRNTTDRLNKLQNDLSLVKSDYEKLSSAQTVKQQIKPSVSFVKTNNTKRGDKSGKKISTMPNDVFVSADRLQKMRQFSQIMQANKVVISKEDFIGGQIVAN